MTVKERVLERLLNSSDFISGQELAKSLNVSRNAVWKAVKSLESDGYSVEAVNNKGYKINSDCNILSEAVILKNLETVSYGRNLIVLSEVDSTNNYAKNLAVNGASDGTVVISDYQTAGKGRMGRSFFSPQKTGIYMSIVIRPDIDMLSAQLITSCVAAATATAIENLCSADVKIKWVNDLYINERKICGILTEASMSFEEKKLDYAVVGIGINVGTTESFPPELKSIVTSIEDETGQKVNRNLLCAEILNCFEKYMSNLESREFMTEYRRRSFIVGKKTAVSRNGKECVGIAVGIDDNANLIVRFENGEEYAVNSGEARIIK